MYICIYIYIYIYIYIVCVCCLDYSYYLYVYSLNTTYSRNSCIYRYSYFALGVVYCEALCY